MEQPDWPAMQALVDRPPAEFGAVHQGVVTDLRLVSAQYRSGPARVHGSAADVACTGHLVVGGPGERYQQIKPVVYPVPGPGFPATRHGARPRPTWPLMSSGRSAR